MLRYFVSGETATRCHMHTVNKIIQAIMLLDSGLKNLDSKESGLKNLDFGLWDQKGV
jgi:hypothetical protein